MEAPRLPSFFKSKGAKSFEFRPRYYDAAKEEREKRNRMILAGKIDSRESETEFQSKIRERWQRSQGGMHQRSRSNFRLFVIILALIMVSYLLLK